MIDPIERQAAIDAMASMLRRKFGIGGDLAEITLAGLPSAQPEPSEITDEQAILHLQSTGWMQNHDREMYESGLRERLADDSGSYDSLIPCEDTISRQAAIDAFMTATSDGDKAEWCRWVLKQLPSAQSEKRTEERTETHACDLIDRQAAQTELMMKCERYTLAKESHGMGHVEWSSDLISVADAMDAIRDLPTAQPEIIRCKECRWRKDQSGSTAWLPCRAIVTPSDFYCGRAERRTDAD